MDVLPVPSTTVVYVTPMVYPSQKAHSVQITRTVTALAGIIPVVLVVKQLAGDAASVRREIEEYYGCEMSKGLRIIQLPGYMFSTFGFPLLLHRIRWLINTDDWVFYTRAYNLARRLIRFKMLHGKRIFFESHLKAGFMKEDPVIGSRYTAIRESWEGGNVKRLRLIHDVYEKADLLFFLHRHSEQWVREHLQVKNTEWVWYGLKRLSYPCFADRPRPFVYCGNIGSHKLFELLIDTASIAGDWLSIDVVGGNEADIASRKKQLRELGLQVRFNFKGFMPSARLPQYLQSYRFGIALLEGMKVVDYVENGVIPIVPQIPSFEEIFDSSNAVFFKPDSDRDLCAALKQCLNGTYNNVGLSQIAHKYALAERAAKIARHCRPSN